MLKRLFSDPAFLFLIGINAYCIWYYQSHPDEFYTIVVLYWGQSVLIGLFNFVDILTIKKIEPGSMEMNKAPASNTFASKGCAASFFAVHYGLFHLAYGMFLLVFTKLKIDFSFVLIGLAAFFVSLIIEFIRHKQWQATNEANIGTMFFLPYLRIIPMHLMILGPAFLHWKASTIFLVLKTLADVIMYLVTSPLHKPDITGRIKKSA